MKNSNDIVKQTAFLMLAFGIVIGLIFPFVSIHLLNVPQEVAYQPFYFMLCIISGMLVGAVAFLLVKISIIKRLANLKKKMEMIALNIQNYRDGKIEDVETCVDCYITQDKDVYGIGDKYNLLISIIREFFLQYQRGDEFYASINKTIDKDTLNNCLVDFIVNNYDSLGVEIFYVDEKGNIKVKNSFLSRGNLIEKYKKSIISILKKGQPFFIENGNIEVQFATSTINPKEVLFMPIQNKQEKILVACYFNKYLKKSDIDFLKRIFYQYSLALNLSNAYESIREIAAIDELTGLYNRRFGMQRLKEDFTRAKRENTSFYIIIFDIDHFKSINDTYGHQTGDFVLKFVAGQIKNNLRIEDVVLRYGGEEFVVGLSCLREKALSKAEKIRKEIEKNIINYGGEKIKVTISAGISETLPSDANSVNQLIKEADEALYQAKATGRNKVCINIGGKCGL